MRASALVSAASAALLAAALLPALPAGATVVVVPSLEEMAVAAEVIAHVKAGAPRVERDDKGRVVTLTPLSVVEGVKGAKAGDILEVFQLGGSLDGKGSWIVGAHRFVAGEELVFVGVRHTRGPGSVIPFGVGFGLFQVTRDDFGVSVVEVVGDVVALERSPDGKTREVAPQVRRFDSLPGFLALLRRAAAAEEAPRLMQIDRRPARAPQGG
ncbi:MAG: hypothetical protein A2138_04425 [Deltaproteobacteria bacterium RBG_16_71_12]|nr:MAG: hypothetical protein A2138_04425 [Deltaproteobacteria bacterium RBG_16_71_12]